MDTGSWIIIAQPFPDQVSKIMPQDGELIGDVSVALALLAQGTHKSEYIAIGGLLAG